MRTHLRLALNRKLRVPLFLFTFIYELIQTNLLLI